MTSDSPALPASFRRIGRVTPRSAKEIESSDWSIGCETLDRDLADYAQYKSYLGPLGAKSVRFQGGWAKTERRRGIYDWTWLDEIIDDALLQGVQPWVELSYGNPLYEGGGGTTLGDGLPRSEEALTAWDAWARALARRYKDRVSTWEIWNEPDVSKEVAPEAYAALYIRTAQIIRAEQPQAKLYALSMAGNMKLAETFLKVLSAQGKLGLVNAITFHGYPHNPDDIGLSTSLRNLVDKYHSKIELREGETGAPSAATKGALGHFSWTELSQAKWDLRRLLAYHGLGIPMNLFTFSDFVYHDARRKGLNTKGLLAIRKDKSVDHVKSAYLAAQNVFAIFDRGPVRDRAFSFSSNADKPLAVDGYRKESPGGFVAAIWFNGAPPTETNDLTAIDFTFKNVQFEAPVYVDLRTGGVFEIPAGSWTHEGREARFHAIPVYDSPILIADRTAFLFK